MLALQEEFQAFYVVRCVRYDDMSRQRHLLDVSLLAQGTSTLTIINPKCTICTS